MNRLTILLLIFLPSACFSQVFINNTKKEIKEKVVANYIGKETINPEFSETDSTLEVKISGKNVIDADYTYKFDLSGKCISQKTITRCDSCHQALLQSVLDLKKYKWRKLNQNQYVSKFSKKVLLEIQELDQTFWFMIFKIKLRRKMYRSL